jgi:hypothetical protein
MVRGLAGALAPQLVRGREPRLALVPVRKWARESAQRWLPLRWRICGVRRGLGRGRALWRGRVERAPQPADRIQGRRRRAIQPLALALRPLWRICVPWAFWWLLWA